MTLGGPSNLHLDILRNRDCTIEWEDVFTGMSYDPYHTHIPKEIELMTNVCV